LKDWWKLRNLLNWAGTALGLAGVVFVAIKFRSQAEAQHQSLRFELGFWLAYVTA